MSEYFYEVSNKWKKSYYEEHDYEKGDQKFTEESMWRWGKWIVKSDLPYIDFVNSIGADTDEGYISNEDAEVEDYVEVDDQCYRGWINLENITEDDIKKLDEDCLIEEEFECVDGRSYMQGPLEVKDVTDEYK